MATAGGRGDVRMREPGSASNLPPPDLGMPSSRRTEAPPVSPANSDGWLSDLLSRTDAGGNAPPPSQRGGRPPQQGGNPLESLSLDIGRLMDRNLAAEMWDRYQRGESKAFSKRLYTPAGQKAFMKSPASIAPTAASNRRSTATSPSSSGCSMRSRARTADRRRCAATSPRRPALSTPCSRMRRDDWDEAYDERRMKNGGLAASVLVCAHPTAATISARSEIAQRSKQHLFDHLNCAASGVSGTAMPSALATFMFHIHGVNAVRPLRIPATRVCALTELTVPATVVLSNCPEIDLS